MGKKHKRGVWGSCGTWGGGVHVLHRTERLAHSEYHQKGKQGGEELPLKSAQGSGGYKIPKRKNHDRRGRNRANFTKIRSNLKSRNTKRRGKRENAKTLSKRKPPKGDWKKCRDRKGENIWGGSIKNACVGGWKKGIQRWWVGGDEEGGRKVGGSRGERG